MFDTIRRIDNAYIVTKDSFFGKKEIAISLKKLKEMINELEEEKMDYCYKCDDVTSHSGNVCDVCGTKKEEDEK